jgi:hypothetical protein
VKSDGCDPWINICREASMRREISKYYLHTIVNFSRTASPIFLFGYSSSTILCRIYRQLWDLWVGSMGTIYG